MPLQAKLLRVIQDGVVPGWAASNRTLCRRPVHLGHQPKPQDAVDTGMLRGDLLPAPRRPSSPRCVSARRNFPSGKPFPDSVWQPHRQMATGFPSSAMQHRLLCVPPWRGQCSGATERHRARGSACRSGPDDPPNDIPVYDDGGERRWRTRSPPASWTRPNHSAKDRVVAQSRRKYLTRLVSRAVETCRRQARLASIDRTTLYRLIGQPLPSG